MEDIEQQLYEAEKMNNEWAERHLAWMKEYGAYQGEGFAAFFERKMGELGKLDAGELGKIAAILTDEACQCFRSDRVSLSDKARKVLDGYVELCLQDVDLKHGVLQDKTESLQKELASVEAGPTESTPAGKTALTTPAMAPRGSGTE